MKRFVVVGLGHFGAWVARALHAGGHEVLAVELDSELVDRHANYVSRAVVGDATNRELLAEIGAGRADAGIVSTGGDLAASILASQALRDLGVEEIRDEVEEARELMAEPEPGGRLERARRGLRRLAEYYLPLLEARQNVDVALEELGGRPSASRAALDSAEAGLRRIATTHGRHLETEMRGPLERIQDAGTAMSAGDTSGARRLLRRLDAQLESIFFRGEIVLEGSELDGR